MSVGEGDRVELARRERPRGRARASRQRSSFSAVRAVPDHRAAHRLRRAARRRCRRRSPTACTSTVSPAATCGLGDHRVVGGDEHLGHAARGDEVERRRARARTAPRARRGARPGRHRPRCRTPARRPPGSVDPAPCRDDLARELEAGDVGGRAGRRGVEARPLREVGPVEAGAVHPHEHLARARLGIGSARRRRAGHRRDVECAHGCGRLPRRTADGRYGAAVAAPALVVLDADGEEAVARRRRGRRPARAHRRPRPRDGLGVPAVPQPDPRGRRPRRPARRRAAVRARQRARRAGRRRAHAARVRARRRRPRAATARGGTPDPRSGPR